MGSKMGFVRFQSVSEARNAQRQLNGVWFLDYRIRVNFAIYNPRRNYWRKMGVIHKETMFLGEEKSPQPMMNMEQNQNFTNVARRSYSKVVQGGVADQRKQQSIIPEKEDRSGDSSKSTFPRDVEIEPGCKGMVVAEHLHWLERSVIGKLKDNLEFDSVLTDINNTECRGVVIRKFSGKEFIITMENSSIFENMEKKNWSPLDPWFVEFTKWTEDRQSINRTMWVACYGSPIQAWCLETFQNVITTIQSKIDDFVSLQVGNYSFNVKVVEINHDCEFTGPCCYEELNFALSKVGLTRKDLQESEEEEDDNGEEDVQAKKTDEDDQSCKEKGAIVPVNEDMHEINCMGTSSLVCVSRQGINRDLKSIDAMTANRDSNEITGVNPIVVNLENNEGSIRALVKAVTESGLEKNILDHDQGGKRLEAKDMGSGPGEIDKPNNLFDAESEFCMGLDKADCGPKGLELTVRAAEDVNLIGLGIYVSNSQEDGDNTTRSNGGQSEWEEDVVEDRLDNYNYSKKWRWVENINDELNRKTNKKGRKFMKKFDRRVYSCRNLAKVGSIANHSLSDGDFRQRKKVLATENEDEVNSINAVDIWNFGKKLGLSADGNDQMVLRKLNDRIRVVKKKGTVVSLYFVSVGCRGKSDIMKIMLWNVRGISSDGKQDRVRRLINRVNPDVVLVQETKLKKCDNLLISKLWPFGKVDWLFSPADGASGGLISLWDRKVFDKWEHRIEKQVIGIRVELVDLPLLDSKFTWFDSGSKRSRIDRFLIDIEEILFIIKLRPLLWVKSITGSDMINEIVWWHGPSANNFSKVNNEARVLLAPGCFMLGYNTQSYVLLLLTLFFSLVFAGEFLISLYDFAARLRKQRSYCTGSARG
ncbi:hypothetical protein REPUB_Repub01dG0103700 [Reevesia pubescens]